MTSQMQRVAMKLWPITILVCCVVMPWAIWKGIKELKNERLSPLQ